ncbi:MAG TPA: LysM peptidoglycan-binding domain-containing protein [Mucilaginibacter sp.]|nr:LysM peptidoglycan-binding domain-containing protein [Mucilaginibacter sp.]
MTLEEIFSILTDNIAANNGTLRLSSQTISSPEITEIFDKYLLNEELVVEKAVPVLNADSVTVTGEGNSLIFFGTNINTLKFIVKDTVPSMSVNAECIIKAEDGWTFGRSFPVLKLGNWDGFYNQANPKKWIQYIYFKEAGFSLSATSLTFNGSLELRDSLSALANLFNIEQVDLSGDITLNKGADGYIVTNETVVPEMRMLGKIGVIDLSLGSFPVFSLHFSMSCVAYIVTKEGESKGRPLPVNELLIESTMPIENETIGIAVVVGSQSDSLTMRAIMPETKEVGISELISLANNENLLALMPSNIPVINDFVLKDWQLTFNTKQKSLTLVTLEVGTREAYSWAIIPGFITLKSVEMFMGMVYLNGTFSPSFTIEGTITLGSGEGAVNFTISASFPSYVFMGALDPDTPVDLRAILVYLLGETIGNSLPDTLKLGVLNITVDPKNSTYSLETALTTDLEIPVVLTTIVVRTILFDISYVAGVATGSMTGEFQIGTDPKAPFVFVTAAYNGPENGWVFSGGLKEGSNINLKNLIDTYLPAEYHDFNPFDITITSLVVTFTQGLVKSYNFKLGAEWRLDLGLTDPFIISGLTDITYTPTNVASPYKGFIEGALDFGNIHVGARVDFKDKYNDYTFILNSFEAKLTHNAEGGSIICFQFTDNTTLGGMIEWLVTAATGQDITLPSPWNVMNNIRLKDFGFSFNITKNKIGLSYRPSINLGFIDIKEITLYYTYYPNDPQKAPLVEIAITQGSFLGGAAPLPQPWNMLDPSNAPAVPGQGENLFKLEFLGMGQHVSLKENLSPDSVAQAIDLLKASFDNKDNKSKINPIEGTGLKFNSSSNWLIGTQFTIVDTFAFGIVFFDPDLYGLSIYVNGPKARVFQGLKFEILYKKVSDTVGVYQVYLKLPDAIRQIDFGQVSVTLPSIKIYIYTNGDFKIDFGFPLNDDFSESFGLQILPFIGSGGFYFGMLSAETAQNVPAATNGDFSPVIVFGVGLRVGVGKEINKGILKAGISIVVQGILEGVFAQFNFYDTSDNRNPEYYYVLGKIAIVGHVFGAVDFLIISAEVDLKVIVSARIVFQSYEPILITLSAGVSVSVKVRINLGLFKISISMSFSTKLDFSFTLGSKQPTPWITSPAYAAYFRQLPLLAIDGEDTCAFVPVMNWQPLIPAEKVELDIIYLPQFTAAADSTGAQKANVVAMLYLESSIDQPSLKKLVYRNGAEEEVDYPFTKFAKGAFLWVLGAYFNQTNEGITVETVLQQEISIAKLNEIICYFSQSDLVEPFSIDQIFDFMSNYLDATVVIPPRAVPGQDVADQSVSVLPILPNLIFETPSGDIYFDSENAQYLYDQTQLRLIHEYFNRLAVRNSNADAQKNVSDEPEEEKQSLATFMLIDYISLLAKEATQKGIDQLTAMGVTVEEGDSIEDIANRYKHFGVSAIELAHANRRRRLRGGVKLGISKVAYTIRHEDTLESVSSRFNVPHQDILQANAFGVQQSTNPCTAQQVFTTAQRIRGVNDDQTLVPGERIIIPGITHITASHENAAENLLSIANRYNIDVLDLISENVSVGGLFPTGKKILVPYAETITVADLIAAMEANHDFEQLSGLSANIMLQGLRVPLPEEDSKIGEPEAMYRVSGQEIDGSALAADQKLTLKIPAALDWLKLGEDGTRIDFTLQTEDIAALSALQDALLKPELMELAASPLFEVQARKFTLPNNITWQLPVAMTLMNGPNTFQDTVDPSIWMFKNDLQALLNGYDAVVPKVRLLKQVQETKTITADPEPVNDYSWSTKIDIRLTQVRSSEDTTQLMPNVYELRGIDQASMMLLRNLVEYYGNNPGTQIISRIDVLYAKEPAKEGQTEPPNGLRSDSLSNTTMFLLQTNLSTLSNPPQSGMRLAAESAPGTQENLLGMTQIDFLKYAWEASVVGTGGYYLYYQIRDSKAGLPDYLFNGDTDNIVTLVVTYNITDDVLLNFLNSVVIRDPINIQDEILYIETLAQTITGVTPGENETLAGFARRHSTTIAEIARQNKKARIRESSSLAIPAVAKNTGTLTHLSAAADTLETLADRYGVSIISLAHANKHLSGLFAEPLTFDSRIEVKVATVPPGNIGFNMKRQNPENMSGLSPAEVNLQQLYNLLGYNIGANEDFDASVPGLPVAPGDNSYVPPTDIDAIVRPSAEIAEDYLYNRILPVYPFVKSVQTLPIVEDVPPEKENPYRAVGKTAQIDLRWQDIFGNLTSFTNTGEPGVPTSLPPQNIGYIDPVIGLSLYPSVSGSYIVEKSDADVPSLFITLAFNPTSYVPVDEEDGSWQQRAETDREAYTQIYYQLIQQDMKVSISNTLEATGNLTGVEDEAKQTLLDMVITIYQYLGELLKAGSEAYVFYVVKEGDTLETIAAEYNTTPQNIRRINPSIPADGKLEEGQKLIIPLTEIPSDQVIVTPVSDTNPSSLFALVTTFSLTRDINLVADDFKDEASVIGSSSVLGPNLKMGGEADNTNSITIQEFARRLEAAFPELKSASGTPQIGTNDDSAIEIWVARFNESATGIQFTVSNAGNPFYFAVLPLSTHLLSRDPVKIYPYVTGTPIWEMTPVEAAFNSVDIEQLARTCLMAIDTFLQADFSIPAWNVENTITQTEVVPDPYQSVINSKKTLAGNISRRIAVVLQDDNNPSQNNIIDASERLRQELLISLSNAYSIDTILQFDVKVTSPYQDPAVAAPQLFGKAVDPNNTTQDDQSAYAFSTSRFSLENSGEGESGDASLTILFNAKKENELNLESGYFPIDLQYEINSIEHDIHAVTGIDGYKSSSWLTFILPFDDENTALGSLKIPVPLRAYPTSPSLTSQTFQAAGDGLLSGQNAEAENPLQQAKEWDYQYVYDYLKAQQDTINADIILNVPAGSLAPKFLAEDDEPDLLVALLQFAGAYQGIQNDFNLYLLDQSNPEYAYTAMQSFAWLVNRVANAWGKWQENQSLYAGLVTDQPEYKYQITEGEKQINDKPVFLITVTPLPGTDFQIPTIDISGFKTETVVDQPTIKSYVYYTENNGERTYLSPEDGRRITQRIVGYQDFNIINQENVWSGISVIRNKILVPGIETNPDFIYTTPVIRFVSVLTPLLDPGIEINMADYSMTGEPELISVYLSNFIKALFVELINQQTTRQIKIGTSYSYNLQAGISSLNAEIPISLSTPYDFKIPADWDAASCPLSPGDVTPESPFVCQLSAVLQTWFASNGPDVTDAKFKFDISLFSGLSNTQLPVLRLRNVYLLEKDIKW